MSDPPARLRVTKGKKMNVKTQYVVTHPEVSESWAFDTYREALDFLTGGNLKGYPIYGWVIDQQHLVYS